MSLADLTGATVSLCLVLYAVFGGADFGGGVWDALASGPRKLEQRKAIHHAMGPVWEANHVWLIFVVVILFTAFPRAWAMITTEQFVPLRLALVGIALRGVAFVFRAYAPAEASARWGRIFGAASIVTPFLLGAALGGLAARGEPGDLTLPLSLGAAAVSLSAYLAAVFLSAATEGEVQEDFRKRALVAGTLVVAGAVVTLPLLALRAPHLFAGLASAKALPFVVGGTVAALTSGGSLLFRRFALARFATAAQVACLVGGFCLAQHPWIVHPVLTLDDALGPRGTVVFLLGSLPFGAALVVPSLVFLFRVFR